MCVWVCGCVRFNIEIAPVPSPYPHPSVLESPSFRINEKWHTLPCMNQVQVFHSLHFLVRNSLSIFPSLSFYPSPFSIVDENIIFSLSLFFFWRGRGRLNPRKENWKQKSTRFLREMALRSQNFFFEQQHLQPQNKTKKPNQKKNKQINKQKQYIYIYI